MMPESQEQRGIGKEKLHGGEWQVRFGEGLVS